jgi:hypothetical protein
LLLACRSRHARRVGRKRAILADLDGASRDGLRHTSGVASAPLDSENPGPNIVESYRDFEPPVSFRQNVETLLRYVPAKYLVGLKTIVLTNRAALSRDKRRQKTWSRNRKVHLAESLGSYTRAWKSSPATVWLYVDNISSGWGKGWKWLPLLRYLATADVLYHEIGHHIHAEHRPIHEGRENIAELWSKKLTGKFLREYYWYLFPLLYVLARLALSVIHWRKKRNATSRILRSDSRR